MEYRLVSEVGPSILVDGMGGSSNYNLLEY